MVLEGDLVSGGGRIDLRTGEVWPQAAIDYAIEVAEIGEDEAYPDRWLLVWCEGSRPGYRDMVWFISDVDDPEIADRLSWDRDPRVWGLPAVQGHPVCVARAAGAVVRLLRGPSTRARTGLAVRRRYAASPPVPGL